MTEYKNEYDLVEKMARDLNCKVDDIIGKSDIKEKVNKSKYISEDVGDFTLEDIFKELEKPGRDPRESAEEFQFADIQKIQHRQSIGAERFSC